MSTATHSFANPNAPTLSRVRALLALMFKLICNPSRFGEVSAMCEEAEHLLARHLFDLLIEQTGRWDLRHTHEPYMHSRGASLGFSIRERPGAVHPFHQIIINRRRRALVDKHQRAMARRTSFSRKFSYLYFRNQSRRQGVTITRRSAACAAPSHTPSRISAPP